VEGICGGSRAKGYSPSYHRRRRPLASRPAAACGPLLRPRPIWSCQTVDLESKPRVCEPFPQFSWLVEEILTRVSPAGIACGHCKLLIIDGAVAACPGTSDPPSECTGGRAASSLTDFTCGTKEEAAIRVNAPGSHRRALPIEPGEERKFLRIVFLAVGHRDPVDA
jgi:hypothetical protein